MLFIIVTLILLAVAIGGFRLYRSSLKEKAEEVGDFKGIPPSLASSVAGGAAVLLVLWIGYSTFVVVSPGYVGVPVFFGSVGEPLASGLSIVNPLTQVTPMSIQTETYAIAGPHVTNDTTVQVGGGPINVITKDDLSVNVDLTILYSLVGPDAGFIYSRFGVDFVEKLVRSPAHAIARDVGSQFTFRDLYSSREVAEPKMQAKLAAIVHDLIAQQDPTGKRTGILIQQILVKRITPPERLIAAINLKKEAEQESERMSFVLTKEKQEAERKRIEAGGIHDFQEIVRMGIDEKLLVWKGIEATQDLAKSTNAKIVIIGNPGNGLPIILGDLMRQLEKPDVTTSAQK